MAPVAAGKIEHSAVFRYQRRVFNNPGRWRFYQNLSCHDAVNVKVNAWPRVLARAYGCGKPVQYKIMGNLRSSELERPFLILPVFFIQGPSAICSSG